MRAIRANAEDVEKSAMFKSIGQATTVHKTNNINDRFAFNVNRGSVANLTF
jgi:hypothetical protein